MDVLKQKSVCYKGDFDCEGERACSEQKEIFVFNQASSGKEPCGLILLCWLILSITFPDFKGFYRWLQCVVTRAKSLTEKGALQLGTEASTTRFGKVMIVKRGYRILRDFEARTSQCTVRARKSSGHDFSFDKTPVVTLCDLAEAKNQWLIEIYPAVNSGEGFNHGIRTSIELFCGSNY